jgi:hypothetical protein
MMDFKLFKVNDDYPEYIIARTADEALADHNERGGVDYAVTMDEVEEVSLDEIGNFAQANGSYKRMTFRQFISETLGSDFTYTKPLCICWND